MAKAETTAPIVDGEIIDGDGVRAAAQMVKDNAGHTTRLLLSIGVAIANQVVDNPTAVNAFNKTGMTEGSSKSNVSFANRFARHADRKAFMTQVGKGIGVNDAYAWLGAIEKAEKADEKAPTFEEFKKAKKAKKAEERAKKNDAQSRKRSVEPDSQTEEEKTPTAGEIAERHAHEVKSSAFKSEETREQFLKNYRTLILRSIDEELALIESSKNVSSKK